MAVDEATKKQNELELFQIDEEAIIPFFEAHLEELKVFINEKKSQNLCLLEILKQFIRSYKLPFNMQRYMAVQTTYIRQTLAEKMQDRQIAVSRWIQENASRHRNRMIQLQCLYLDRIKERLLPEIEKMLERKLEQKLGELQEKQTKL